MDGYIKIDEAIEALYRYSFVSKKTIEEDIRAIPSIDIVRCKNCRYCKMKKTTFRGEPYIYYRCALLEREVEDDEFCSWGDEK